VKYAESKPELKVMVGFSRRCTYPHRQVGQCHRWLRTKVDAKIQSTNRTKQLINGSHRAKRVGSTLSILLLVIYMMRLGFSFSIVRLVGGFSLIVVSLSDIHSFPHPIILFLLCTSRYSFFTSHIPPSSPHFPFCTISNLTIVKDTQSSI
jgi:hypothetical protein